MMSYVDRTLETFLDGTLEQRHNDSAYRLAQVAQVPTVFSSSHPGQLAECALDDVMVACREATCEECQWCWR